MGGRRGAGLFSGAWCVEVRVQVMTQDLDVYHGGQVVDMLWRGVSNLVT